MNENTNEKISTSWLKKNMLWLIIGAGLLIAIVVIAVLFFTRPRGEGQRNAGNNTSQTQTTKSSNSSYASGVDPSAATLPCTPEAGDGHSNYRTQETLTVDPTNTNVLYVAVEYKGVFKSVDGGTTWKKIVNGITAYNKVGGGKCYQEFGRMLIDPKDSQHIILSRVETPGTITDLFSETAGIWESKNGGESWTQMLKPNMNASGSHGIAFGENSQTLYYSTNNNPASYSQADQNKYYNTNGVAYKTTDGGATWTELKTGIKKGLRGIQIFANGKNLVLFTAVLGNGGAADNENPYAILTSSNGGDTWTSLAEKLPASDRTIIGADVSSNNFDHWFFSPQTQGRPSSYYTTDGGKTLKKSSMYMFAANYDPTDATGMRMYGYNPFEAGGKVLYKSTDAGATWSSAGTIPAEVNGEANGIRLTKFVVDPKTPTIMYASGNGGYVWKSTDSGKTWKVLASTATLK